MPPKKKLKIEDIAKGPINLYQIMPEEFLTKTENPNFDLHKIKLPFRMLCVAPSNSGKTTWIANLLILFCARKGTFSSIHIVTANSDEPIYQWLASLSHQIRVVEGLKNLPKLDDFDKRENHLVILDDLVLEKNQERVEQYAIRCRKLSVSLIYISQSYFRIPKMIRLNCNYLAILKVNGQRDLGLILNEGGLGVSKEELLRLYETATSEKFNCLLIDYEAPPESRYRKNWNEILEVHR